MTKNLHLFLSSLLLIFVLIGSASAEVNYYPKELIKSIETLNQNFNKKNLQNTYNIFISHKGIKDSTITYTLVDIALKHKNSLTNEEIDIITKFNIDDKKTIKLLLNNNYLNRLSLVPNYISKLSIYAIMKYTSYIFLILIFLSLFIKNRFIFFHAHNEKSTILSILQISLFLFIALLTGAFFPYYISLFIGVASIILLIPEKSINCIILFIVISAAVIFNSIDYQIERNFNNETMYSLINNPVSAEYLDSKINKNPENFNLRVLKSIKYPTLSAGIFNSPPIKMSKIEQTNLATYYLMNKNFKKFKQLISKDLFEDPITMINLSSYYSNTFQYKELEEINKRLYYHKFFYKISETYQHHTDKNIFLPYAGVKKNIFSETLSINKQKSFISGFILFIFFILAIYISKLKEIFKCNSCGEIYCAHCDDGFVFDQVCAACRNIIHKKSNAEAAILVKKTILMENNKERAAVYSRILSAILPGAGQIYMNHPIIGSIMAFFVSFIIFLSIFRFEPFIGVESYGLHLVFVPLYIIFVSLFIVIYLINMFSRK